MKSKWLLPLAIGVALFVVVGQGLKGGPEITVQEFAALMKGDPPPAVIDVRTHAEYAQGHIPGAQSVPLAQFKGRVDSLKLPKFDTVVIYGADDTLAREATKQLYESGYGGGVTLKGGITAWQAAGHALTQPPAQKP
ncbi:MAG: rhodanese-like domain-containing protein [Betaproteobacteria bacterium]|nr:rhodanese-like domain-containing protein [Betaproteobacteria bacterium]